MKKLSLLLVGFFIWSTVFGQAPFKNGDKICFMGNSITSGGRYHSYIFLYYATRFPNIRLSFINCGIAGDEVKDMYKRLDNDFYNYKPTVGVLFAGMNDVNRGLYSAKNTSPNNSKLKMDAIENYKTTFIKIADSYAQHKLKTIFFTPSIYDEEVLSDVESLRGVNLALKECRDFTIEQAEKYNASLIDLWQPMDAMNRNEQKENPSFTLTSKDRTHPKSTGNMVMAYLFLRQMNAPKFVWNLSIDADSKQITKSENCQVANVAFSSSGIRFTNNEFSLPFPQIEAVKEAYQLVPINDSLNQQILSVKLPIKGNYALKINNVEVGTYSDVDFNNGVNLALNLKTPQYAISEKIAKLCEEHFTKGALIRTLRKVEYKQLANNDLSDKNATKDFLKNYIQELKTTKNGENNAAVYISNSETYLKEIDNEKSILEGMKMIENEIYKLNKPAIYTYTIELK